MSITPQQAFEAVCALRDDVTRIERRGDTINIWGRNGDHQGWWTANNIDWGDLTQYPPPEPKWRPATVEDAIRALLGEKIKCRFKDQNDVPWNYDGTLVSVVPFFNSPRYQFAVRCSGGVSYWKHCEVQE